MICRSVHLVLIAATIGLGMASSLLADAPMRSPRPEARIETPPPVAASRASRPTAYRIVVGFNPKVRPTPRPDAKAQTRSTKRLAALTVTRKPTTLSDVGKICGDKTIKGRKIQPIAGSKSGCGVAEPIQVVEIDGVRLSQASTMNCETARALKSWINSGLKPTINRLGGGVDTIRVAAHYSCRTRNNKVGAKISEHGKGNAIDISGFRLKNGVDITVLNGWRNKQQGKLLRDMHKAACGPFGTVLGPNSDRYHKDHFHFDVARHRGGPYCR